MAQLFHVGLTVKNLERSLAFYRDVAEMTRKNISRSEAKHSTRSPTTQARR